MIAGPARRKLRGVGCAIWSDTLHGIRRVVVCCLHRRAREQISEVLRKHTLYTEAVFQAKVYQNTYAILFTNLTSTYSFTLPSVNQGLLRVRGAAGCCGQGLQPQLQHILAVHRLLIFQLPIKLPIDGIFMYACGHVMNE